MKRLISMLVFLALLLGTAAAEFDQAGLEAMTGCQVYMDVNGVDTIVRPMDQPWQGETELEDSELLVYLDFIQMPNEDATFLRLTLALKSCEYLAANEMTISVGGTDYVFDVFPQVWEYDMTYFEDYITCMTDESLPMIKAMARSKTDTFAIKLAGEKEVGGSITLNLDRVAELYDAYINFGGAQQNLELCRELWPVMIIKQ